MIMILGITGGVGAGKSTVLHVLETEFHAHIIQSDQVAKDLMVPGGATYEPLVQLFGPDILDADGSINRGRMAAAMYASAALVSKVDAIVHPRVRDAILTEIRTSKALLIVVESALIREGRLDELCDTIWYIYASPEVRIERLMASRGYTREKCLSILDKQSSDEAYRALSDIVLNNDGTPEQTRTQIHMLLDDLFETDTPEDGGATL